MHMPLQLLKLWSRRPKHGSIDIRASSNIYDGSIIIKLAEFLFLTNTEEHVKKLLIINILLEKLSSDTVNIKPCYTPRDPPVWWC